MGNRLERGNAAPPITVIDMQGTNVSLTDLWGDGLTLVTFLRHFG